MRWLPRLLFWLACAEVGAVLALLLWQARQANYLTPLTFIMYALTAAAFVTVRDAWRKA